MASWWSSGGGGFGREECGTVLAGCAETGSNRKESPGWDAAWTFWGGLRWNKVVGWWPVFAFNSTSSRWSQMTIFVTNFLHSRSFCVSETHTLKDIILLLDTERVSLYSANYCQLMQSQFFCMLKNRNLWDNKLLGRRKLQKSPSSQKS